MLTLFSYPELYGVADNNPYGLKIFAFLKLCHLSFQHKHVFDARQAPRAQLPYLLDGEQVIGDSDAIIAHLIEQYDLAIDRGLTPSQRDTGLLVRKLLDDLYWIMSYSRWKDPRFWPLFRDALLTTHPDLAPAALDAARDYNFKFHGGRWGYPYRRPGAAGRQHWHRNWHGSIFWRKQSDQLFRQRRRCLDLL